MTLKTTMMAGAALAVLAAPLAMAHDGHHKAHGGFSVGAQAGYVTGESRYDRFYLPTLPAGNQAKLGSADVSGRGAVGGLNLGYGHVFSNHLYAGLELKGEFSGLKGSTADFLAANQNFNYNLRMKNSIGAALKLGMVVNSVLPYAQIGIVSSKFESKLDTTAGVTPPETKSDKRLTGFEFGVGIKVPVSERWSVDGKFLHTEYGNHNYRLNNSVAGFPLGDFKVKPRTNAFMLAVNYRFW